LLLEHTSIFGLFPKLGRDVEAQASRHAGWQTESKGLFVLKDQSKITQPGPKVQDMGKRLDLKFEHPTFFIEQAKIPNEGRAAQIGFDVGLKLDQPFGQFDHQPVLVGLLEHQQA
jgi:hypothetical protein